jgi:hypothetical protein
MNQYTNQLLRNVNANHFITPTTPEHAYLLGFIWADGSIIKLKQRNTESIRLEIVTSDMLDIQPVLTYTGKWGMHTRIRPNRKPQTTAYTSNKKLSDFLIDCEYKEKSKLSPNKILNIIPLNLHEFFLRGVIDGDGCFYYKGQTFQFSLAGSFEQDWSAFEQIFSNLGIKYTIQRIVKNDRSASSAIRITNRNGIIKLGEFIYCNRLDIGLSRKQLKYNNLKNEIKLKHKKNLNIYSK